jgi:hypothetical protein
VVAAARLWRFESSPEHNFLIMNKEDIKIIKFLLLCTVILVIIFTSQAIFEKFINKKVETPRLTYIPQFVLISFDGAKSVDIWKDLRMFKEEMKSSDKFMNFTYFMNTAYLLTEETKNLYKGPRHERGISDIGFSEDMDNVSIRINEMNRAISDGDEIAIHTTGHLSGLGWSKDEWNSELDSFHDILFSLENIYEKSYIPKLNLIREDVSGFRAPYLDTSPGLFEALHDRHLSYDSSEIGYKDAWPKKDDHGMWRIPLGIINLGKEKKKVLAMDYNIYVHHSQVPSMITKGGEDWQAAYDETLSAFLEYFNRNYTGKRAPVLIGYHFESWNDGVYWEVLKAFASEVCGKPEVRCGTFKELVKYLEEYGVPKK